MTRIVDEIDWRTCPMRVYNALDRNGIRTYSQLARLTDRELLMMRAFGPKSLAELNAHLAAREIRATTRNVEQLTAELHARHDTRRAVFESAAKAIAALTGEDPNAVLVQMQLAELNERAWRELPA